MNAPFDVVVVGAGQAGLAAGYYLQRAGLRFTLLDAGEAVGDAWRRRWDSLRLFTPARYNALPGLAFPGPRYALPGKDEVAEYLSGYARTFRLPVRLRTPVTALRRDGDAFAVTTAGGEILSASAVIVATGANQRPRIPPFAAEVDPRIVSLHSSGYRLPAQLPTGRVLVVGAGNSGVQIATELAGSGREVTLSGRLPGSIPRRILGRDVYDWLRPTVMRPSVGSRLGRWLMAGRLFRGDLLIGLGARDLEIPGLSRAGRVVAMRAGRPVLEDGRVLDDVASIVWCTGFRPDYDWIELPAFGLDGYPRHRRGLVAGVPGLAFLGMRFQHRPGSALLGGVGEDAEFVARAVTEHVRRAGRAQSMNIVAGASSSARSPCTNVAARSPSTMR